MQFTTTSSLFWLSNSGACVYLYKRIAVTRPLTSAPNHRTPGAEPYDNLIKHPRRVLSKCLNYQRFVCLKLFYLCLHPTLCPNTEFVVVNKSHGMFRLFPISPECVSSAKCNYCIVELTFSRH